MTKPKKPKKAKPKNARKNKKYPALDPKYNPKIRHDNMDADYLHLLNDEQKAWYNKFMEEENNASFNHDDDLNLNKTKEEKRVVYGKNNARQRCVYSNMKAAGRLILTNNVTSLVESEREIDENYEDYLIEVIDERDRLLGGEDWDNNDDGDSDS